MDTAKQNPYFSNRDDDRFLETAAHWHAGLKTSAPELAFNPQMAREAFPQWKEKVRNQLRTLLAFPETEAASPPVRVSVQDRDTYTLERWEAYPLPRCVLPFLVLIPRDVTPERPAAGVLCFPGSGRTKENLAGEPEVGDAPTGSDWKWRENRMALHFVRAGMVAVAVDNPAHGECASSGLDRNAFSLSLLWSGWSYEGLAVYRASHLLQWAMRDPRIRTDQIAASGHSLGAKYADMLCLLNPGQVKAVVHNDCIIHWKERLIALNGEPRPAYQIVPGFLKWFDYLDLQAALAPVPVLYSEGGRTDYIQKLQAAYRIAGAEDHLTVHHYEKYDSPIKRPLDQAPIPEGIDMTEFFRYANIDPENHRFRPDRAIPWLQAVLGT